MGSLALAKWTAKQISTNPIGPSGRLERALKNAFPDISDSIGERGTPTITKTVTVGKHSLALVTLGTGGAYTDYYSVVRIVNTAGVLAFRVVSFECAGGSPKPLYFPSGSSVRHEERVELVPVPNTSAGLRHVSLSLNEKGDIDELHIQTFVWDNRKEVFVCIPELSTQVGPQTHDAAAYSWEKPVPLNTEVTASYTFGSIKTFPSTIQVKLLKIERIKENDPRYDMILRVNSDLKIGKKTGYEFLLAKVGLRYLDGSAPDDQQFMLNPLYLFVAYSADGKERYATLQNYPTGLMGLLVAKRYYVEGYIVFHVRSDDHKPRIGLLPDQTSPELAPTVWFQGWAGSDP